MESDTETSDYAVHPNWTAFPSSGPAYPPSDFDPTIQRRLFEDGTAATSADIVPDLQTRHDGEREAKIGSTSSAPGRPVPTRGSSRPLLPRPAASSSNSIRVWSPIASKKPKSAAEDPTPYTVQDFVDGIKRHAAVAGDSDLVTGWMVDKWRWYRRGHNNASLGIVEVCHSSLSDLNLPRSENNPAEALTTPFTSEKGKRILRLTQEELTSRLCRNMLYSAQACLDRQPGKKGEADSMTTRYDVIKPELLGIPSCRVAIPVPTTSGDNYRFLIVFAPASMIHNARRHPMSSIDILDPAPTSTSELEEMRKQQQD